MSCWHWQRLFCAGYTLVDGTGVRLSKRLNTYAMVIFSTAPARSTGDDCAAAGSVALSVTLTVEKGILAGLALYGDLMGWRYGPY
ncbi:hypothetical protein KCP73_12705 [Salmonella enterica subsp. enterica]|nr:hypothetical protein KCP73_12705 [Salmonella enterica subsp. enterica]